MNDTALTFLTGQQAAKWLNLNYRTFIKEVNKGLIGYKIIGSTRRYPIKALEEWLNSITYHTDYTNEVKSTTPTSRSLPPMEPELTLEDLRNKYFPKKRRNGASDTSKN